MFKHENTIWSGDDFDQLGWNMSRLYGIVLPGRQHRLTFHVDYILESPLSNTSDEDWSIAPAKLEFFDVVGLNIQLAQTNHSEVCFVSVERSNQRPTPNGKLVYWDYKIELSSESIIEFTATGFQKTLLANSEKTENQDLDREMVF